jgi:hypothetical protein
VSGASVPSVSTTTRATGSAVTHGQVLAYRAAVQQLTRAHGSLVETALLDLGAQDTGPDGALWALAVRGLNVRSLAADDLVMVWSLRGAPHAYRRSDLPSVAAALEPYSDEDAGKRILNASKPLRIAGIGNLEGLDVVAAAMREVVSAPLGKGEVSSRLAQRLPEPYLRWCSVCRATHPFELPLRLGALRAGLALEPGTSPPVLRPVGGRFRPAKRVQPQHDLIRATLHLLGPATPKLVAGFLDVPVKDVAARWPEDAAEVSVAGESRWILRADAAALHDAALAESGSWARLLGPYDLFLQCRDRELLVDDPAKAKTLWPAIGRPGAVLLSGEVVGAWRPRARGKKLTVAVDLWRPRVTAGQRALICAQAELLAEFRCVTSVDVRFEK